MSEDGGEVAQAPGEGASARLIEWTGERCVPWTHDAQVVYEHYHRYLLVEPLVRGKRVLDLASGEGYGTALLAASATTAVGVEIDSDAVAHSRQRYSADGLSFEQGSMLDLSAFEDGSFDVVTCFEAIEHVAEHEQVLREIRRVLGTDGLLLMSTPDRLQYTEHAHQENHFHVRELSVAEFRDLLDGVFPNVRLWGQGVVVGSLVLAIDEGNGAFELVPFQRQDDGWTTRPDIPPTYAVAMASAAPLPDLPSTSLLVDVELELVREAQRQTQANVQAVAELRDLLGHRDADLARREEDIVTLKEAIAARDEALAELERRTAQAESDLRDSERAVHSAHLATARAEAATEAARAEVDELRGSAGMRLIRKYQLALDRAAPDGSRRRAAYARAARTAGQAPRGSEDSARHS